jgi:diguanylate cyclase (GGDEF)-like protein
MARAAADARASAERSRRRLTSALALAVLTLLGAVGRMAATFVENIRLAEASRAEALTDPLTGLANRRALMDDLESAFASGRVRLLVTFDLNGFKLYNDTFGHPRGDALLREMGGRLDAAVAGTGKAYRHGGDEFCVLYDTGAAASDVSVAAVRAALSDRGQGVQVTAAYGTVELPTEAADVTAALQLADERMYAHKRSLREMRDSAVDFGAVQIPASLTGDGQAVGS